VITEILTSHKGAKMHRSGLLVALKKKITPINTYFSTNAIASRRYATHRHNFAIQNALVPLMPDEKNNFVAP